MMVNIKSDDLVLEVGSGDFPSVFSDCLVDKHPSDNFQRNKDIHIDKRPFIVADAQKLPFKDKAFDYYIASNILPYVDDPEVFFCEMMRVSPRGVIIAISEIFERIRDIAPHKWYVNIAKGELILKKKESPDRQFGKLFHILCEEDKYFRKFINKHWFLFNLTYPWETSINYKIIKPYEKAIDLEDAEVVRGLLNDKRRKIIQAINLMVPSQFKNWILSNRIKLKRKKTRKIDLNAILACPACKGDLNIYTKMIVCRNCKREYPIKNNIPYLLVNE